jgi:HEPN domain-containing protein
MNREKKEYIKNWLFRANEDIAVIDNLINAGIENYTSTICFHAQQATEKFLKTFLVYHDVDFPRTHDLDFLLLECKKINKGAFQDINLKSLSEFGVSVRYPDDFYIPTVSEAVEYHQVAKEVKETVEELVSPQPK